MNFEDLLPCAMHFINWPQSKPDVSSLHFSFTEI